MIQTFIDFWKRPQIERRITWNGQHGNKKYRIEFRIWPNIRWRSYNINYFDTLDEAIEMLSLINDEWVVCHPLTITEQLRAKGIK